eukprot:COSAG06_NODE_3188_length_5711_cov_19.904490_1_plen_76_part_00
MTVGYAGAPAIDVAARARARDTALSCASGSTSRPRSHIPPRGWDNVISWSGSRQVDEVCVCVATDAAETQVFDES